MYQLKRDWNVHLIHHTHLDIGYTHTQNEVMEIQINHLKEAFKLIEKNKNKKAGEQFKWNPEITWAIEGFLKKASKEEKDKFIKYVQQGFIGIDALYGNVLTGLSRPEELMASFNCKKELERITGTTIDSAMITDIPGFTWGFVTVLAENGVKYLSAGPNRSDRIGRIRKFSDKPFYWESPSGEEEVLIFVHGKGYSWFHTGLKSAKRLSRKLKPFRLYKYLRKLEKEGYPYDDIIIRYNIGQDNGPTCKDLCCIAENWNKEHANMKLNITTTSEAFKTFENKYKKIIPRRKGDMTPYWEDGALSTARETAIAKEAAERLTVTDSVNGILGIEVDLTEVYKKVFLFNEHTWGAYNSISKPDHPFAVSQWNYKKQFALDAYSESKEALHKAVKLKLLNRDSLMIQNDIEVKCFGDRISIINPHSYSVTEIVYVNTEKIGVTFEGAEVISQKLKDGRLLFLAEDIMPYESRVYSLTYKEYTAKANIEKKIEIDISSNGTIDSFLYKGKQLVKQNKEINTYIYQSGKWGTKTHVHKAKDVKCALVDTGCLVDIYKVVKDEYKTNAIESTYCLDHVNATLYIENIVDRPVQRKKEGIYFEFPFNINNGRILYDTIYGSCEVNADQLDGANKNFITANRFLDVSNKDRGMTVALIDSPIFKAGEISHDPIRSGPPAFCGWKEQIKYTGTVYSYMMNNYWMTNYKKDQPGKTVFRYKLMPHDEYNPTKAYKFSESASQPLLVFEGWISNESVNFFDNDNVIITRIKLKDKKRYLRLFNPSANEECINQSNDYMVLSPNKEHKINRNILTIKQQETILIKEI